jgi:hypothetical protein
MPHRVRARRDATRDLLPNVWRDGKEPTARFRCDEAESLPWQEERLLSVAQMLLLLEEQLSQRR